jgi:hypothetical protein
MIKMEHVGSRVTCNPAPTNTDDDWLYLVPDLMKFVVDAMKDGFYVDGSLMGGRNWDERDCPNGLFVSLKKVGDNRNLIITSDDNFYRRFIAATHVCKKLNLLNKRDRISLFQAVLYGVCYD